jgi:hypothetical protein
MPSKKPARTETPMPIGAPLTIEKSPEKSADRMAPPFGQTATLIIAGCVLAGGILIAARQQAQPLLTTTPSQDVVLAPEAPASHAAAPKMAATTGAASSSAAASAAPVTITGCLEVDKDGFRLKDTTGADAPKSRSWKSGFLKKGQAKIELVAAPGTNLATQVGRRVSVTGTLDDRQMEVRSVRRMSASCDTP